TMALFAEHLRSCYLKTGFGDSRIFQGAFEGNVVTKSSGCGLCSALYFDDDALALLQDVDFTHDEFVNYLQQHPHRIGSGVSYWEYLNLHDFNQHFPNVYNIPKGSLQDMATVYVMR